tara:strand:- start:54 stop:368 length:315 start_codon:yes stop_codon:yes gene_type:complete
MADALVYAAIASTLITGGATISQGDRQRKSQRRALRRQEQAQTQARSATASNRLAQAAEAKKMQKRQPNTSAIMARARQRRMGGETFLSNQQGMGMLDRTRYLG